MKQAKLSAILTDGEIKQAAEMFVQLKDTGTFARQVSEQLIKPSMDRINKNLGQENDPDYLAYVVEYLFTKNDPLIRAYLEKQE